MVTKSNLAETVGAIRGKVGGLTVELGHERDVECLALAHVLIQQLLADVRALAADVETALAERLEIPGLPMLERHVTVQIEDEKR